MGETRYIITSSEVSKLKKRATRLQRSSGDPRHLILDRLAQELALPNWHRLTVQASQTDVAVQAYHNGFVIAVDLKEADDFGDGDSQFQRDDLLLAFCRPSIVEHRVARSLSEPEREREWPSLEVARQEAEAHADLELAYYRSVSSSVPNTPHEAVELATGLSELCPEWLWLRGTLQSL